MKAHWTVCVAVLLGAGVLGVALTGCSKERYKYLTTAPDTVIVHVPDPPDTVNVPGPRDTVNVPGPRDTVIVGDRVVSSVTLSVDPATFNGVCPGDFRFSGGIALKHSSFVVYRWERSDGYVGDLVFLGDRGGTISVETSWASLPRGRHWVRLHVLAPNDVVSEVAVANWCVPLTVGATAQVEPATYNGSCPGTFDFTGRISSNGPAWVQYRWEGSDGHIGPEQVLSFSYAGAERVVLRRSMIVEGVVTERIHILAPRDTFSAPVRFTNACEGLAVEAIAWAGAWSDPCYGIFDFMGQITTNASTVTYQWEFSDGSAGPVETLSFGAPGTQTVSTSWQLPTDTGWARLHVLTPIDVSSNLAEAWYECSDCGMGGWCDKANRMREKGAQILRHRK